MGIEIGAQLDALWRSLFLGAAFALLYDGLRALRLRRRTRRALTDLLDALYCLFRGVGAERDKSAIMRAFLRNAVKVRRACPVCSVLFCAACAFYRQRS